MAEMKKEWKIRFTATADMGCGSYNDLEGISKNAPCLICLPKTMKLKQDEIYVIDAVIKLKAKVD